jgi:Histidine kinase-, DNA gyrase B-, and HSP90-like ATPase
MELSKVDIRPGTSILAILKRVEYDHWNALAEFIDNAIDSAQKFSSDLVSLHGNNYMLRVDISIDDIDNEITIRDNAAGIHEKDYPRAFRAAEIPPDNTGLSEFGMGMKSAACWLSDNWSVKTSALGENIERIVTFDLSKIFHDKIEELEINKQFQREDAHYTVVTLSKIDKNKMPNTKTKNKIKEHLASIYRSFLRDNKLELIFNGYNLTYKEPKFLSAPFPYDSNNEPILWKKDIDFFIGENLYVKGFIGLLETMSTNHNGLALFRRGRVVQGSADEGFKPKEIMGDAGSFEYKRIFGEFHMDGFEVSFTKKGIKWDANMDIFLDILKSDLIASNYLKQAREYRVKPTREEILKNAQRVLDNTVDDIKDSVAEAINEIRLSGTNIETTILKPVAELQYREFEIDFNDTMWHITIELTHNDSISDWIEVGSHLIKNKISKKDTRQVGVRMSLNHPFVTHFAGSDKSKLEPILRMAAAIGLAEEAAREAGVLKIGILRMNLNKLLNSISNY